MICGSLRSAAADRRIPIVTGRPIPIVRHGRAILKAVFLGWKIADKPATLALPAYSSIFSPLVVSDATIKPSE
jgi:hypothetical protein